MKAKNFFSKNDQNEIVNLIKQLENKTTGEIRIHLEDICEINVIDRAKEVFAKLEMHKTKLKNGVLLYISIENRKLAIIGDTAINAKVGQYFWDGTIEQLKDSFINKNYLLGVLDALKSIGYQLSIYFPYNNEDTNELPNEISFE